MRQSTFRLKRSSRRAIRSKRGQRGAAIIIALALTLCLTMLIVGTQLQIVTQLKGEKGQRDYDRALEMAEAGANAYINYLSTSNSTNETPWGNAAPPTISGANSLQLSQIRSDILAGNIKRWDGTTAAKTNTVNGTPYSPSMGLVIYPAQSAIATKPSINNQTGYFVVLTSLSATGFNMVSFGYANGVVRRVQVGGGALNVFDWAALWGMDTTSGEKSWNIGGNFAVVGAFGGEGEMDFGNNTTFYEGDSVRSGSLANFYLSNTIDNTPMLSGGTPTGFSSYDPVPPPGTNKAFTRRLYIPTADAAANQLSGTTQGVEYFRTHNNNLTGIRYLVQNTSTGNIYELTSTSYTVTATNNKGLSQSPSDTYVLKANGSLGNPGNNTLQGWGMPATGFAFYGVRVYPGDYFFEQVQNDSGNAILEFRSFSDYDQANTTMTGSPGTGGVYRWPQTPIVYDMATYNLNGTNVQPTNPNYANYGTSGTHLDDGTLANGPHDIRFWIGHASNSSSSQDHDPNSAAAFGVTTYMEWPQYPSRFRAYISSNSGATVKGNNSSPIDFNTNILVYNYHDGNNKNLSGNTYYGTIDVGSSTYLRGSLIAWQITSNNGATVQKVAPEGGGSGGSGTGNSNRLVYYSTGWKELP